MALTDETRITTAARYPEYAQLRRAEHARQVRERRALRLAVCAVGVVLSALTLWVMTASAAHIAAPGVM